MKSFKNILYALLFMLPLLTFGGCGDDIPEPIPVDLLVGIWSDADGHYLEIIDRDHMYEYELAEDGGDLYWLKYRQVYLYEPYNELILREDTQGGLHVYKLLQFGGNSMTVSLVASPVIDNLDGDNKYDFLKIFFNKDYVVDPAKNVTYRSVTRSDLERLLSEHEVIEL